MVARSCPVQPLHVLGVVEHSRVEYLPQEPLSVVLREYMCSGLFGSFPVLLMLTEATNKKKKMT